VGVRIGYWVLGIWDVGVFRIGVWVLGNGRVGVGTLVGVGDGACAEQEMHNAQSAIAMIGYWILGIG
jgi:hypothetical protein